MQNLSSRRSPAGRRCGAILIAAIAAALLAACGNSSPEQELLDKADPAGAWISTLQMAGEKWLANSVPTSFVKTICEAADEDLDQAAQETAESKARSAVREPLRRLISEAQGAGTSLRRAAAANDRPEAGRQAGRLAALHRQFEDWKNSVSTP